MSDEKKSRMTVLVTQCIVCAVVLILGLCIRFFGGSMAAEARERLFSALADNTFADSLFDPPQATTTTTTTATTATNTTSVPAATTTRAVEEKQLVAADATIPAHREQQATELPSPVCLPLGEGMLTSAFGEREHPLYGGASVHTGWDIGAAEGTPLLAMYDGTVTETGSGGSYGNYVEIRINGDWAVLYAHCQKLLVEKGDKVKAGQRVALVGSTGVSTGNHLHLELLLQGTPVDPALVLPLSTYEGP